MRNVTLQRSGAAAVPAAAERANAPPAPALGNQAHLRRLQASLTVGRVDDPLEREADVAADRAVTGRDAGPLSPAGAAVNRACSACEEEDKELKRQAAGPSAAPAAMDAAAAPPSVDRALAGPGAPLDAAARDQLGPRLGGDFSAVRVHDDADAHASARQVGANAYTVGQDLVFAAGQYRPAEPAGRRLIAHELAHVVQQGGARGAVLRRDPPLAVDKAAAPPSNDPGAAATKPPEPTAPDVPLKEAKAEDATDAMKDGLKTVGSELFKNEKFKNFGLALGKQYALPIWTGASDADKGAIIGEGVLLVGTGLGALLSNPQGRQLLSGLDILAPLSLVPYATLSGFKYELPKSKLDPLKLHLSFDAKDLIGLAAGKLGVPPPVTASFDITMAVGPDGKVTTPSALAKFAPVPGLTIAAGYGVATDFAKPIPDASGGVALNPKSAPTAAQPAPPAGAAVFVSVDLTQAPFVPKAVRQALGAATGN
jgi:hypothetical protein